MNQTVKDFQKIVEMSRKVEGLYGCIEGKSDDFIYGCKLYSSIDSNHQHIYVNIIPKKIEPFFYNSAEDIANKMGRHVINEKREMYRALVPREVHKEDIGEHEMILTDYSPFTDASNRNMIAHMQLSIIPSGIFQRDFQGSAENVGEALDNFFRKAGNDQDVHTALDKIHKYWVKKRDTRPEYSVVEELRKAGFMRSEGDALNRADTPKESIEKAKKLLEQAITKLP